MEAKHTWEATLAVLGSFCGLIVGIGVAVGPDWSAKLDLLAIFAIQGASIILHGLAGAFFGGRIDRLRASWED